MNKLLSNKFDHIIAINKFVEYLKTFNLSEIETETKENLDDNISPTDRAGRY